MIYQTYIEGGVSMIRMCSPAGVVGAVDIAAVQPVVVVTLTVGVRGIGK